MRLCIILFLFLFSLCSSCESQSHHVSDAGVDSGSDADVAQDVVADAADGDLADGGPDADGGSDVIEPEPAPVRYRQTQAISPITRYVVENMNAIIANNPASLQDVFMKAGASGTVSHNLLYCFAGGSYTIDLDVYGHLAPSIAWFAAGDAAGSTPFDRDTLAAVSGRTASWVMSGDPSPFDEERLALNPRYAFINYGTNDMEMGVTYRSALFPFVRNFEALLIHAMTNGIVPLITGLNPRSDNIDATWWVPVYNAVTRALAEKYQVPYIDMYLLSSPLDDMGLVADGIHGNVYSDSDYQPCVFTPEALGFNYNNRNLYSMELLHQIKTSVVDGGVAPSHAADEHVGAGSADDPVLIDSLPFSHHADTRDATSSLIDAYPLCDSEQDESGAEVYYRLELPEATPLRIIVLDDSDGDMDIHMVQGAPAAEGCVERDDRIIEGTFEAGTWYIIVDTYVSGGEPQPGAYTLVVLTCDPADTDCF